MTVNNLTIEESLDEKSFEKLFKEYFESLTYFAQKFVADFDTAREIVHDVYVSVWNKRTNINLSKSVKSYLYSSVHNRCLNYIRDNKKIDKNIVELESTHTDENWEKSDVLEELELEEKIEKTIDNLPDRCKEVFILNRFEGLKYKEVAEKLGISVKTVEIQMSKALKALRENLSEYLTLFILIVIHIIKKIL